MAPGNRSQTRTLNRSMRWDMFPVFDVESGLLVQLGFYYIDDYREVNGVKIPFKIKLSRKGGSSTYFIEEVKNNIPIEDAIFSPSKN